MKNKRTLDYPWGVRLGRNLHNVSNASLEGTKSENKVVSYTIECIAK
jgi:hypothetical protein